MNYDMNDGIPPYDLPFGDSPNNEEPVEKETNQNIPDANPTPEVEEEEHPQVELDEELIQSDQLNVGEFVDGVVTEDYAPDSYGSSGNKKSKAVSLPLIIVGVGILLAGSIFAIYGTDLIPGLKFNLSSIKLPGSIASKEKENLDDVKELPDLNDEDTSIDTAENENYNDVDIDLAKNRNKNKVAPKYGDDMSNDLDLPPLPGVGGKQPSSNGFEGKNKSDNELSVSRTPSYSGNVGRVDPFNPNGGTDQLFDILVPPTDPTPDIEAQMLLTLKITGIMYTPEAPSALINIAGADQLVRTGDKIENFVVERITKDKVTVRNGKNVFTASVGETVDVRRAGVNPIPNLNKKFAGPYSKGKDRIIEINTIK